MGHRGEQQGHRGAPPIPGPGQQSQRHRLTPNSEPKHSFSLLASGFRHSDRKPEQQGPSVLPTGSTAVNAHSTKPSGPPVCHSLTRSTPDVLFCPGRGCQAPTLWMGMPSCLLPACGKDGGASEPPAQDFQNWDEASVPGPLGRPCPASVQNPCHQCPSHGSRGSAPRSPHCSVCS